MKFLYEIKLNVEQEEVTAYGNLYFPSTPSVKRKPDGYIPSAACFNRTLASQERRVREFNILKQILKKLDKRKLKYTIHYEKRQPMQTQWSILGKWEKVPVGDPVTYCVIQSIEKGSINGDTRNNINSFNSNTALTRETK